MENIVPDQGMKPGERAPRDVFLDTIWPDRYHDMMYEQWMLNLMRELSKRPMPKADKIIMEMCENVACPMEE